MSAVNRDYPWGVSGVIPPPWGKGWLAMLAVARLVAFHGRRRHSHVIGEVLLLRGIGLLIISIAQCGAPNGLLPRRREHQG
jgi:hypothetical protein